MTSGWQPTAANFYPRPPRGGRRPVRVGDLSDIEISIHALREEGDRLSACGSGHGLSFLSTPSARRATVRQQPRRYAKKHFYPRPPRGGRPDPDSLLVTDEIFLSTPSARRATVFAPGSAVAVQNFYPRPPRGGRRCICSRLRRSRTNFYPRPPRGGRPVYSTHFSSCT